MSKSERMHNIENVIKHLDISPSLYQNAIEKYNNLANYLKDNGLVANMYPQGSFAIGTVVRPSKKNENPSYDLDFICEVSGNRESCTPLGVYNQIKNILENSKVYSERLDVWPECFTIKYADVGDIGFSIDVVPATEESKQIKEKIERVCDKEIADTAIAIPCSDESGKYSWLTNNPLGYRKWFDEINAPYKEASREQYRQALFESSDVYASIEEIPEDMERSSLQRVIQILKAHRNNYFFDEEKTKLKPKSVIITTLVAEEASHLPSSLGTFELLAQVMKELRIYANRQNMSEAIFEATFGIHTAIIRSNGIWEMPNPANPDDNLVNSWNEDEKLANAFFNWLEIAERELLNSLDKDDQEFRAIMENAFGSENIQKTWNDKYVTKPAQGIEKASVGRPWSRR